MRLTSDEIALIEPNLTTFSRSNLIERQAVAAEVKTYRSIAKIKNYVLFYRFLESMLGTRGMRQFLE